MSEPAHGALVEEIDRIVDSLYPTQLKVTTTCFPVYNRQS